MDEDSAELTGDNVENQNMKMKGLSGKELSSEWPQIMTLEEHQQVIEEAAEGITPEDWNPVEKLSYRIKSENGQTLEYEAVTHSNDPDHPQFNSLEERYKKLKPTIVLYEAPGESTWIAPNREEAIKTGGEVAYIQYLAGSAGVESRSLDVTHQEWIKGLKDKDYSNEEIAVFDAARWVHRKAQAAIEAEVDLDKAEIDFKDDYKNSDMAQSLKLVPRSDGKEWTYELVQSEYEERVGKQITFRSKDARDGENEGNLLRRMVEDEDKFRETMMIENITDALKTHNAVMAVAGSSHPVRQKKALEEFMDSKGN